MGNAADKLCKVLNECNMLNPDPDSDQDSSDEGGEMYTKEYFDNLEQKKQ